MNINERSFSSRQGGGGRGRGPAHARGQPADRWPGGWQALRLYIVVTAIPHLHREQVLQHHDALRGWLELQNPLPLLQQKLRRVRHQQGEWQRRRPPGKKRRPKRRRETRASERHPRMRWRPRDTLKRKQGLRSASGPSRSLRSQRWTTWNFSTRQPA